MCDNIFHILNICGVAFILTADKNTCSPSKQNEVNGKKKKKFKSDFWVSKETKTISEILIVLR